MKRNLGGRRSLEPVLIPKILFLFMLGYTIYNILFSQYNVFKVLGLKRSMQEVEKKIDYYISEREKLEQILELIRNHPEHFKERFAREYMQMQKEGERILILKD